MYPHFLTRGGLFVPGGEAEKPKKKKERLSKKNSNKELYVFDDVKKKINKTKIFNNFLIKNNLKNVLIVSDKETEKNIFKSVRNIPDVKLINENGANVYDLFKFKNVLFTTTSIKNVQNRLINEKN